MAGMRPEVLASSGLWGSELCVQTVQPQPCAPITSFSPFPLVEENETIQIAQQSLSLQWECIPPKGVSEEMRVP